MRSLLILLALTACSRREGRFDLDDGTELSVVDGQIELAVDGAVGFALAGAPEVRRFEETWSGPFAIYEFERDDEQRETLVLDRVRRDGDAVVVDYTAEAGTATLTVAPSSAGTAFTLTYDGEADSLAVPVRCDDDGSFHGFGEQYAATNLEGHAFDLIVEEQGIGRDPDGFAPLAGNAYSTYFPMPWWLDARGHGVLFDTAHRVTADVCATDEAVAWIEVVSGEPVTWTVFHGPDPLDVIAQLGEVVGRPAPVPDWAWGTWICTQGGEQAVRDQAAFLASENIPVTALWVQDWTGTTANIDGGYGVNYRWEADTEVLYPDLRGLVDELHNQDLRVLAYVNSFIDSDLPNHFDEMEAAGMLPLNPEGETYTFLGPRNDVTVADFTNPDTRDYARAALVDAIETWDLDGWMADFGEWLPIDATVHDGSDGMVAHNLYPVDWHTVVREAIDEARPDGDFVTYARSGFTGVQGVAQVHWVGDQEADDHLTDGLPTVVPAMLTLSMAGQPHVTHDIAGFSGGPSTKELYLRWTELGAFSPFMRTHDGNARDANWRFDSDAETTAHFRRFSAIHDLLAPELKALADDAQTTSAPIVRHLMLAYPDDAETWNLDDQYLLGEDLLVAPILQTGLTERDVYLPEGTWFDVWTGEQLAGPGWVTRSAPIGSPPVFSRGEDRSDLRAVP
ncbi:MAG: hypothetical protein EP330_01695 [Deltaproteobacteria bacterium]|nr:MAG: hypothetical protein EP330_01695 [Deltaproteobacteria bacterium]